MVQTVYALEVFNERSHHGTFHSLWCTPQPMEGLVEDTLHLNPYGLPKCAHTKPSTVRGAHHGLLGVPYSAL